MLFVEHRFSAFGYLTTARSLGICFVFVSNSNLEFGLALGVRSPNICCAPVRLNSTTASLYLRIMGCSSSKANMNDAVQNPNSSSDSVLGHGLKDVNGDYHLGKVLGRGQFGTTRLAEDANARGQTYACKSIAKGKLSCKEDIEDVQREVQIMHHLKGHPNVTYLRGTYEDKQNVHLVMDLCGGGELFDAIIKRGKYSERDAADLIRTIVNVVAHCHNMGVIHRDLKPENFLLQTPEDDSPVLCTDFGLSVFFKPGERFKDIVGSAYYVAPEVLRRDYGPEADIWSCGVILYILLSGMPPFWGIPRMTSSRAF